MKQITFLTMLSAFVLLSCNSPNCQEESLIIGKWTAFVEYDGSIIETNTHLVFEKDSVAWEINRINGKEERRYYVKDNFIHLYDTDWIIETKIEILKLDTNYIKLDIMGMVLEFNRK